MRIIILLLFIITCLHGFSQKIVIGIQTNIINTAHRYNSMIGFGDTLYLKSATTQASSSIFPTFTYECINKSRTTFNFQMYKESINTDVHEDSPFLIADPNPGFGSFTIAKKWRKIELSFEKPVIKQKLISLSLYGGLGFLWQRKNRLNEDTSDRYKYLENELNTKYNGTGSFVTGTFGVSVKRKRLSLNIDVGRTFLTLKKQQDFISGIVYNQIGLKYDFYYKTLVEDQRKKEQLKNTGLKEQYRFEMGLLFDYSLITRFKQQGSQVYVRGSNVYSFAGKPEIKASPEFGLKAKWIPKNNLFSINTILSGQVLSVKYINARTYLSDGNGFVSIIDIKTKVSRYLFSLGIEKKIGTFQRIKPFVGIYLSYNYMKTNPIAFTTEPNSPSTVYNYNLFRSHMLTYTANIGFNYKRLGLALSYNSLSGRFNTSGNYILSDLSQLKIRFTLELIKLK